MLRTSSKKKAAAPAPRRADDRRAGAPKNPLFIDLLLDAGWEPGGVEMVKHAGWMRAHGHAADRRRGDRRARSGNA